MIKNHETFIKIIFIFFSGITQGLTDKPSCILNVLCEMVHLYQKHQRYVKIRKKIAAINLFKAVVLLCT